MLINMFGSVIIVEAV